MKSLIETGEKSAMETVMLGDRIRNRAKEKEMVIFDSITHWNEEARSENIPQHLSKAYEMGIKFWDTQNFQSCGEIKSNRRLNLEEKEKCWLMRIAHVKRKNANVTGSVMNAENTMRNPSVKDLVNERKRA